MAAFSPFHLDSSSSLLFLQNPPSQTVPYNINDNDKSASKNTTTMDLMDSSSVVTDKPTAATKRKCRKGPSVNSAQSKENGMKKQKKVKNGDKGIEGEKEPPLGYIHVRARRGQATDSHSLAERERRGRISERLKLLQALVPGCDKVTGKALMLDEIINYVQSLQNQVEFLSMKLATVNPMFYDFGMELESFMVNPDQDLNNLPSPLPNMLQEFSLTAANTSHPLENSANYSISFPQAQNPNLFHQGSGQALWEMDEHRQRIISEPGFNSNTLFSFH